MKQAVFYYPHECAIPRRILTLVYAIFSQESPDPTPQPISLPSPYPRMTTIRGVCVSGGQALPTWVRVTGDFSAAHRYAERAVGTEATHSRSPPPPGCSRVQRSAAGRAPNGPQRRPHLQPRNGTKRPAASSPQGCRWLTARSRRGWAPTLGHRLLARTGRRERLARARRAPRCRLTAPRQPAGAAAAVPAPLPP